jgi:hypothetical protein
LELIRKRDNDGGYKAFVRYVLEHLSANQLNDITPTRFVGGIGEGIDVRETLRHLHEGGIYIREPQRTPIGTRNGLIDYTSYREDSWILQEAGFGASGVTPGWIDPSLLNVGSASWSVRESTPLQEEPFLIQRMYRDLSLITLDAPTWLKADDTRSFYGKVIQPLLKLTPRDNNLYGWLQSCSASVKTSRSPTSVATSRDHVFTPLRAILEYESFTCR